MVLRLRKKFNLIFLFIFALTVSFNSFAQEKEYPKAILKNPFPIKGLSWINNDQSFLYTEEMNVIVRKTENLSIENIFSASDADIEEATYYPSGSEYDKMLVHSKDGNIYTITFQDGKISTIPVEEAYKKRSSKIAFNKTGNYIGFGLEDGNVYLIETLQVTGQVYTRLYENGFHSPVYTLSFSDDGTYMAVASDENMINIWDIHKGGKGFVDQLYFNSAIKAPVLFTQDSKSAIYAYDNKNIIIKEFSKTQRQFGEIDAQAELKIRRVEKKKKKQKKEKAGPMTDAQKEIQKIKEASENEELTVTPEDDVYYEADGATVMHIDDGIVDYKLSHDGTKLIVHTKLNQLRYYDISTGQQLGYIPNFDESEISDFALNSDDTIILISHENGMVFLFNVNDNFFDPREELYCARKTIQL